MRQEEFKMERTGLVEIGQVIPTVMLFVPSKDGRSHCQVEHTEYSEFAKASVIMNGLAKKLLAR